MQVLVAQCAGIAIIHRTDCCKIFYCILYTTILELDTDITLASMLPAWTKKDIDDTQES